MQLLADNGGYVLAEDGARLLFFRRRILPTWLAFVLGLLAVVALVNGVVQIVVASTAAGAVLLALGVLSGLGLRVVLARRRRAKAAALDPVTAVLAIDLRTRTLRDGLGSTLAPLDQVRIDRAMQATSSSRALRVSWPDGALVVYRGDPFAPRGSIAEPVAALQQRGLPVA